MIPDPLFYFVAIPAVLLAGISKGGFGGGLAMLSVPMMATVVSVPRAAAIMLPILCLMDLMGAWTYRKTWHALNLKIVAAGALIGIGIGTATFHMLNDDTIRIMVGCVAVSFTLNHWMKRGGPRAATEPNVLKGMAWGAVAGFTSFIAHAGGPPSNAYLLPQRMDKTLFVGTMIMVFTAINYTKLVAYWWLDLLPIGNLTMSLVLCPLAPIGIALGVWLHKRVSSTWFYRLCYLFLFASGCKLLYDGAKHLIG